MWNRIAYKQTGHPCGTEQPTNRQVTNLQDSVQKDRSAITNRIAYKQTGHLSRINRMDQKQTGYPSRVYRIAFKQKGRLSRTRQHTNYRHSLYHPSQRGQPTNRQVTTHHEQDSPQIDRPPITKFTEQRPNRQVTRHEQDSLRIDRLPIMNRIAHKQTNYHSS